MSDKHTSLLCYRTNYESEKFFITCPEEGKIAYNDREVITTVKIFEVDGPVT
jgi:hypothetical protein